MSRFKVGDKVVRKPDHIQDFLWEGGGAGVFTVTKVSKSGDIVHIDRDGFEEFGWDSAKFDLVEATPDLSHNVQYYIPLIEQWGRDRGILDNSTPLGQSRKTVEEVRELVEEAAILHACDTIHQGPYEKDEDYRNATLDNLADAIGDIFVTLVMVAGCAKLDINTCVAQAYETIKDRTGRLNSQGVWEKDA